MTALSNFSKEEKDLLVRLPYQVGMLIADADEDDDVEESDQEQRALLSILNLLPGLYEQAPVVQEILRETSTHEDDWEAWSNSKDNFANDCTQAITSLKEKASEGEAKAYRKALLEIADTVARAAGAAGAVEITQEPDGGFLKVLNDTMKTLGFSKSASDANISQAEKKLINKLDQALQI